MSEEKFTPGEWCLRTINQFAEYGNSTKHIFEKNTSKLQKVKEYDYECFKMIL